MPSCVQRNVSARDLFGSTAGRDELHERAGAAGLALLLAVEIHAVERVFKNEGGPARSARRMAVAAVVEKPKLELQKIQEVAVVFFRFGHSGLQ